MNRTMGLAPDLATFEQLVGTRFRLRLDEENSVEVELAQLKNTSSPSWEQFTLLFQAPTEAPAEQRIYVLEQEAIGAFEIFLVPIGRTEGGLQYEAVFNRRVEPTKGGD
jgi:hypothetical protein